MKKFNPNNFDIRKVIKDRVNLEAEIEHVNDPRPKVPIPVKIIKDRKYDPGWWNFVKMVLNELNP
jgi:Mg-chelatase subunit ChlI